jgi:hypothetical protein
MFEQSKLWFFSVESNIHNLKFQQLCEMKDGKSDEITKRKLKNAMYLDWLMVKSCPSILLLCTLVKFVLQQSQVLGSDILLRSS